MNTVKIVNIPLAYERPKPNMVLAYDLSVVESKIEYEIKYKGVVRISPSGYGGNHVHKRIESWVALGGELELVWIEDGIKKSIIMNPKDNKDICLITISSNIPHVVRNISGSDAYLIEYADQAQTDVAPFDVINSVNKNE